MIENMRDPLQATPYDTDRTEFVGLTLEVAKERIKAAKLHPYVVWVDGEWNKTIRTAELKPKEVKLVVKDGIVQRAYQIL